MLLGRYTEGTDYKYGMVWYGMCYTEIVPLIWTVYTVGNIVLVVEYRVLGVKCEVYAC